MKVSIIGYGFLGGCMYDALKDTDHDIVISDPARGFHHRIEDADLSIICVPTPPGPNGECNTSIVRKVVSESSAKVILIKSTVAPGTCRQLTTDFPDKRIVFSPEYMGESKYFVPDKWVNPRDVKRHGFMILGGNEEDTGAVIDFFLPIFGPTCRFRQMSWEQAEIIKYAENSFFALKVSFANEIRRLCEAMGVGYHAVREGWIDDPRTNPNHSAAFRDERGFGGKCFPKDLAALAYVFRELNMESPLLEGVLAANEVHHED